MGFGHRVYKNYDPRATIVKASADEVLEQARRRRRAARPRQAARGDARCPTTTSSSASSTRTSTSTPALIYQAMGFPTKMFTVLFALGRLPGWIAHWREMINDPATKIGRPRQVYTGSTERAYLPIDAALTPPPCATCRGFLDRRVRPQCGRSPTAGRVVAMTADAAIVWFRRDLRLRRPPDAARRRRGRRGAGSALFVLDPATARRRPARRGGRSCPAACATLDARARRSAAGRARRPGRRRAARSRARGRRAGTVHVAADYGPYGRGPGRAGGRCTARTTVSELVRTGSPYAVAPGRVRKPDGDPLPGVHPVPPRLAAARLAQRRPTPTRGTVDWLDPADSTAVRAGAIPDDEPARRRAAGGRRGRRARRAGGSSVRGRRRDALRRAIRDRPDRAGTTRMSPYLKYGCIHPRTLLADLAGRAGEAAERVPHRAGLAGVLRRRAVPPRRTRRGDNFDRRFDAMPWDERRRGRAAVRRPGATGRTGYPIVDAGMRQLRAEGWMHNRVRMIVASFLVKDLHLPWQWGARHFMRHLVDGDLASNQHGWQWVGRLRHRRRAVLPDLQPDQPRARSSTRTATTSAATCPSCAASAARPCTGRGSCPTAHPPAIPSPIVDHAAERVDALARYERIKAR